MADTDKKNKRKNIISAVFVLAVLVLVFLWIGLSGDLAQTWETITKADYRWMGAAFMVWGLFTFLDAMDMRAYIFMMTRKHYKKRYFVIASLIGMFYSNVTPASTGGQPMQVISLKKHGIHAGMASSCLAIKFFCWEVALLVTGTVLWIIFPGSLQMTSRPYFFIILGYLINGAIIALVLMLVVNPKFVDKIVNCVLRVGHFFHLVKDAGVSRKKMENSIAEFNTSVDMVKHHPYMLLNLVLINMLRVVALMAITYCVYRAVGLGVPGADNELIVASFFDILTIQTLLYITVSFFPMPGAAGASEFGFGGFFGKILGSKAGATMLIWRFFTFYVMIAFGFLGVMADSGLWKKIVKRKNTKEAKETEASEGAAIEDHQ